MEPSDRRLKVDLRELREPWLAWCYQNNVASSDAFRQVVAKLTAQPPSTMPAHVIVFDKPEKCTIKKKVSLTPSEAELAEALARKEGFSVAKWIVACVRSRLSSTPQIGQAELEALTQSNLLLLAIGRNLNQIARALNIAPQHHGAYRIEVIEEAVALIRDHTVHVSRLLAANLKRWKIE